MIVRRKERLLSAAVFVPVALMVIVLAFVQYRSSNEESQATSLRLADSLQMSMINWHQDLFRDLTHICEISLLDREERTVTDLQRYTRSLAEWRSIARYPDLVSNLYVARTNAAGSELLRYDAINGHFQPEAWTTRFLVLEQELAQVTDTKTANVATVPDHDHRSVSRLPIANAFY